MESCLSVHKRNTKNIKIWEKLGYLSMIGLFLGQALIGINFVLGEIAYVITDVLIVARNFALDRPIADKIKDIALMILATLVLISKL